MAKKKESVINILPPRIYIDEFLAMNPDMTEIQKAGFKAFCNGKKWMRNEEWLQKLKEYKNRK